MALESPKLAKKFSVFGELSLARRWLDIDLNGKAVATFRGTEPRIRVGLTYQVASTLALVASGWLSFGSYGSATYQDTNGSTEPDLASASHTFLGGSLGVTWDAVVFQRTTPTWP